MGYFTEWDADTKQTLLICGIGVGLATGAGIVYYLHKTSEHKEWKKVGVVSKLIIHPARSSRGLEVDEFLCETQGPVFKHGIGFDR